MNDKQEKIVFAGAGSISTAIGNTLARAGHKVLLYTIEEHVAEAINTQHINTDYFPNASLSTNLTASTDVESLRNAGILFLGIPSIITVDFVLQNKEHLGPDTILVNLAKGFGCGKMTITSCLEKMLDNPVCTLKGPTFAREIINGMPTALTFASGDEALYKIVKEIFNDTSIYLDYTQDVEGVEYLSILKNIYAITLGIVDAHFDSPNLRFLILTKAFDEMRRIMLRAGGEESSMFHYCGYGDFSLTALNDLSRNRTLGLLIGKGFFSDDISDKVVLEGKMAVNTICQDILNEKEKKDFPLIFELNSIFDNGYDISSFVSKILKLAR